MRVVRGAGMRGTLVVPMNIFFVGSCLTCYASSSEDVHIVNSVHVTLLR